MDSGDGAAESVGPLGVGALNFTHCNKDCRVCSPIKGQVLNPALNGPP